ncbi:MAG: hypothetical protein ACJA0V_003739 [Planctomycetota bacterium]|jgi:hypothetical protein
MTDPAESDLRARLAAAITRQRSESERLLSLLESWSDVFEDAEEGRFKEWMAACQAVRDAIQVGAFESAHDGACACRNVEGLPSLRELLQLWRSEGRPRNAVRVSRSDSFAWRKQWGGGQCSVYAFVPAEPNGTAREGCQPYLHVATLTTLTRRDILDEHAVCVVAHSDARRKIFDVHGVTADEDAQQIASALAQRIEAMGLGGQDYGCVIGAGPGEARVVCVLRAGGTEPC